MKRYMMILMTLAGMASMTHAQGVDGVKVSRQGMQRSGDYMAVNMDLDLATLDVASNRAVLLTPMIVNGDRQEVINLYEDMSKLLLTKFGIMPDQESRALYREAIRSVKNGRAVSPEEITDQLREQGSIHSALVCDFDFFKMVTGAQVIFLRTVIFGKRLKCWKTIPIF